jgi:phospholipid/cholesterol/gamma-HCH transport system ATP-binding protein
MDIIFENVYKSLAGRPVLNGLSFKVEKGETFVIVGPSGTGKSVTLSHIIGLFKADSGKVCVGGQDMDTLSSKGLERLRSRMGMLFQGGALLNWMNVRDNIALPLKENSHLSHGEIDKKVMEMLEFLEMEDAAVKMPDEISGGMKKRAGLARAIVMNPEIMLFDEPTAGLDPVMSRKIDSLIVSLKGKFNMTSVVVTHDLVSAFGVADRVAMLEDGKIIACGTPDEFMKSEKELVREFIAAQSTIRKVAP